MSRPEETLDQLARLAREDEALLEELPAELAAPLSKEKTASLVDAIQARLAASGGTDAAPTKTVAASSRPLSFRRRGLVAAGGTALAAIAAGVLLWVGLPLDSTTPLPVYAARVEGFQQSDRSGTQPGDSLKLRPGSKLRFELRPKQDFAEAVRARVQLETFELEPTQEQSAAGALRVEVRVPDPLPERGELTLVLTRASDSTGRDTQRFRWQFERVP